MLVSMVRLGTLMPQTIAFHFDPACPWAWQSSVWLRRAATVRDLEIRWLLFSLAVVNAPAEKRPEAVLSDAVALRSLAWVRREQGNDAVGALYQALGTRVHERGERMSDGLLAGALEDAGLDASVAEQALADDTTVTDILDQHEEAAGRAGCFGVPTIVMPSGRAMFGPVVSTAPAPPEAGELWDHVSWLVEHERFFELKRDRDRGPGSG